MPWILMIHARWMPPNLNWAGGYIAFARHVLEKKRTYRLTGPRTSKPLLLLYRFLIKKKQKKSRSAVLIPSNNSAMFFTVSPTFLQSDQIILTIGNSIFGSKLSSGKCSRNCISPSKGNFNKWSSKCLSSAKPTRKIVFCTPSDSKPSHILSVNAKGKYAENTVINHRLVKENELIISLVNYNELITSVIN